MMTFTGAGLVILTLAVCRIILPAGLLIGLARWLKNHDHHVRKPA